METTQASTLERTLHLSIALPQVEAEVDKRLKRMSKTLRIQGFRPGKAPLRIVMQQYGGQVHQEALGEMAQQRFTEAVTREQMRVAGFPRFEPKTDAAQGTFEFMAHFEVFPEVVLGDLTQQRVERTVTEVTEADVDRTLDILRRQRMRYETVERPAQKEDQVVLDYAGFLDDQPFDGGTAQNQRLVLGKGRFLADFETALEGMQAGATKSFPLSFPQDYQAPALAGKTVRFDVTVHAVNQGVLPDLDAEFVQTIGVKSGDLTKLRKELRTNLERETRTRTKAILKERVMNALLEATPLVVPNVLVQQEIQKLRQGAMEELTARQGGKLPNVNLPDSMFEAQARRRISLGILLAEIIQREGLEASPDQVRAAVEEMAQAYEHPQEFVRWYFQQPERLEEVRSLVLEDCVVDWVCQRAQMVDVPTPFEQLAGQTGAAA